jgi:hypothetical protein
MESININPFSKKKNFENEQKQVFIHFTTNGLPEALDTWKVSCK